MKRVLVVEDEPAIRALISATLAEDCEVATLGDGSSALASVEQLKPDLILLDVGLPGINGGEVLTRLRDEPATASIPIILLTGLEPPEGAVPDAVLLKPFTPALLRECLAPWLS
jgi:CheY-like chemotaxis protein